MVPDDAGIKIPVVNPEDTVGGLAAGIRLLAESAATRQRLGQAGWTHAQAHGWPQRVEQVLRWYVEVIEKSRVASTTLVYAKP